MPSAGEAVLAVVADRAPGDPGEPGAGGLEGLLDGPDLGRAAVAERGRLGEEARPGSPRAARRRSGEARRPGRSPSPRTSRRASVTTPSADVARSELDAHRHALQLPVGHAPAEAGGDLGVHRRPDAGRGQLGGHPPRLVGHGPVVVLAHHEHHGLDVGDPRRHAQPVLVAVAHDEPADHPGRGAPRGRPAGLEHAVVVQVLHAEGARRSWCRARGSCPSGGRGRRPSSPRRSSC